MFVDRLINGLRRSAVWCDDRSPVKQQVLPATPTFLNMLLMSKADAGYNLSSLKLITYGTPTFIQVDWLSFDFVEKIPSSVNPYVCFSRTSGNTTNMLSKCSPPPRPF
jgi:hypothetical protein